MFQCSIFIQVYEVHQTYSLSFTFSPSQWYPPLDRTYFYLPMLHFFKSINCSKGWNTMAVVFHTHTHIHTSDYPPLLFFPYCPVPLIVNSFQCISLYHLHTRCNVFQFYSLSLFPLLSPPSLLRQTHNFIHALSLHIYNIYACINTIYVHIFVCIYVYKIIYVFMHTFVF
jgi:hypothetical protein